MDFIIKLPRTMCGVDSIWVIIDKLSKSAHFIPISEIISTGKLANIYIPKVVDRCGCRFWWFRTEMFISPVGVGGSFTDLGTQLPYSTTYHPQNDE